MHLDIQDTHDVKRNSVEVTAAFAQSMQQAWSVVLRRTRYADEEGRGVDGTVFQFCGDLNRFGETWNLTRGFPAMLSNLGQKLGKLACSDEKARESLIHECDELAKAIVAKAAEVEPANGK